MDIKTTGGIVKEDDVIKILKVISDVFSCPIDEIFNLKPLQKGITNAILSFEIKTKNMFIGTLEQGQKHWLIEGGKRFFKSKPLISK